jgi:type II secretory pathway pseudopilin PulG
VLLVILIAILLTAVYLYKIVGIDKKQAVAAEQERMRVIRAAEQERVRTFIHNKPQSINSLSHQLLQSESADVQRTTGKVSVGDSADFKLSPIPESLYKPPPKSWDSMGVNKEIGVEIIREPQISKE